MPDSNRYDERKNLKKDALTLFGGGLGASVFATIEVVLIARFLGLEQFGLFSLVLSYVGIVNTLVDFKIGEASVKYVAEYREKGDGESVRSFVKLFYAIDFFSGVLAFAVCIALAGAANEFLIKSEDYFQYVLILSLSLLFSTVNQNSYAILGALKKFRATAFFKTFHAFVRLALIVAAFVSGFGLKGFFAAYVFAAAVNFAVLQFFVNTTLVREGIGGWLFADLAKIRGKMREALWFVMNTGISGFLSFSSSAHIPILLLGHFSGAEASGLYKVARSVVKVLESIYVPVLSVMYPAIVRVRARESYKELRQIIVYSVREIIKISAPVCVFLFVFADFIINFVYGTEYVLADKAMRIMVISGFLLSVACWHTPVLLALEMPGIRTVFFLAVTALKLLFCLILIPRYSYEGAAYADLVSAIVIFILVVFLFVYVRVKERKRAV